MLQKPNIWKFKLKLKELKEIMEIEEIESFMYLGVSLSSRCEEKTEIDSRIAPKLRDAQEVQEYAISCRLNK